ncbi:uncharacterized protein BT62DRAFT_976420 [Guyanagaster necrorhizus]|uniref:F-box domain-containing protein n=1 Tax=Guyanagaster necrorhizus TaxID=856835 RepID=A0A9P7VG59_9AGAR|nr:uncharacterized protein BT62DRAFT_976420 [Guyanagaster necrorhizus MCA 3950]KAG7439967.1 hypothetical protein BT62DRAFT_976420 [Guyanagaster necrorhizus MCA 3950]
MAFNTMQLSSEELIDALMHRIQKNTPKWDIAKIDALENRLQMAMAVVRGARNSHQPINRIPPELLAAIFSMTQYHPPGFLPLVGPGTDYTKGCHWLSLLEVCRHWRGVGTAFHSLWAIIDNGLFPLTFLKRSSESLLTIIVGLTKIKFDQQYLAKIIGELPRIREFHVDFCHSDSLLESSVFLSKNAAPNLVSLSLLPNRRRHVALGVSSTLSKLFMGDMPKLKQLCLGFFTSWPPDYFKNLTHLCLHNQDTLTRPSTSEFLDFLESSPLLEKLALIDAGPTRYIPDDLPLVPADRIIVLNHLIEINVKTSSGIASITRLLSHLTLPEQTNMFLWGQPLVPRPEEVSSLFPSDIFRLQNVQNIQEYRLIEQGSEGWSSPDIVAIVNGVLFIRGNSALTELATLLPLRFPQNNIKRLLFNASSSSHFDTISRMWRVAFEHMPSLEVITIRSCDMHKTKVILEGLYPRGTDKSFPCPLLTSLRIEKYMSDISTFLAFFMAILAEERRGIESVEIVSLNKSPAKRWVDVWSVPDSSYSDSDFEEDGCEDDQDEVEGTTSQSDGVDALKRRVRNVKQMKRANSYRHWTPKEWPTQAYLWQKECEMRISSSHRV